MHACTCALLSIACPWQHGCDTSMAACMTAESNHVCVFMCYLIGPLSSTLPSPPSHTRLPHSFNAPGFGGSLFQLPRNIASCQKATPIYCDSTHASAHASASVLSHMHSMKLCELPPSSSCIHRFMKDFRARTPANAAYDSQQVQVCPLGPGSMYAEGCAAVVCLYGSVWFWGRNVSS